MRILVAIAQVPFLRRATETLAEELAAALRRRGDRAEIVRVPLSAATPDRLLDHMVATRLMDWSGPDATLGDLLIALEFPTYLIPHPRKLLWLAHDRHDGGGEIDVTATPGTSTAFDAAIEVRRRLDRDRLAGMERRFAVSAEVAAGLKSRCGLDATPLYAPPLHAAELAWRRPEDYFLVPPGLGATRIELALEALATSSTPARLKIGGRVDDRLADLAPRLGLADRVDWLGERPLAEMAAFYGSSFAVLYPARGESVRPVAQHAGLSSKAVITSTDSGAPAELVRHEGTGAVVAPTATALAAAIDDAWTHPGRTAAWGRAGREEAERPELSWSHVLSELLRPTVVGLAAGTRR